MLVTAAPAELGDHTKALADAAQVLNAWASSGPCTHRRLRRVEHRLSQRRPRVAGAADARKLIDCAVKIGATTAAAARMRPRLRRRALGGGALVWAGDIPVRIIHMTELLDELIVNSGKIKLKPIATVGTFHDPCQLVRRGGVNEAAARDVLAALGLQLTELQDTTVR
jgi:hypothetical protein